MRSAPPVEIHGHVPSGLGRVGVSAATVTGGLMGGWLAGHWAFAPGPTALLVLGLAGLGALAMRALAGCWRGRRPAVSAAGGLAWDGERWTWQGREVLPEVALDFGTMALMRLHAPARRSSRWLWVDGRRSPQAWHALRCALWAGALPASSRPGSPAPGSRT